jgi:hypothetical protein
MILRAMAVARRGLGYWKLLLELLLVGFFVLYACEHRLEIAALVARFSIIELAACGIIYTVSHFLANAATYVLLGATGYRVSYTTLLGLYLRRLPAKYLPGGIWHTVGRGHGLLAMNVPKQATASVLLAEQLLALWWSGFLGLSLAVCVLDDSSQLFALAILVVWLFGAAVLRWVNLRFRLMANSVEAVSYGITLSCIYVAGWTVLAAAFCLYLRLGGIVDTSLLRIVAGYFISWLLGALAFFAPQGMGIFELAMSKVIAGTGPTSATLVWLLGGYRVIILIADLIAWLVWSIVHRVRGIKASLT